MVFLISTKYLGHITSLNCKGDEQYFNTVYGGRKLKTPVDE